MAQGLQFNDNGYPIDRRTSFRVYQNPKTKYTDFFEISFDLSTYKGGMGYIFRIKDENNSKIYNLHYDGRDSDSEATFKLNEEGKSSILSCNVSQSDLLYPQWSRFSIKFSFVDNSITLSINDSTKVLPDANLPQNYTPDITFGKSEYMIDVPAIILRNLSVGNTTKDYFPLDEHENEEVHNSKGEVVGMVDNPVWFINYSYNWKYKANFNSPTQAGSTYSVKNHKLYYFNQEWIQVFDTKRNTEERIIYAELCPVQLALASCFVDDEENRLYVYEPFYYGEYDGATVASLDLDTYQWQIESYERIQKEVNHHSFFFDEAGKEFIIFGGYGNLLYSNNFNSYNLENKTWQDMGTMEGDPILPRYFSSIGYNKKSHSAYLFGGMGNESGEHIVGRKYFYDLYRINWKSKVVEKLWQVSWKHDNVVPARGLVLDGNYFYTLAYPEHLTESLLQLYRFSIENGEYQTLGDTIPIYSDKISTRANLFYDAALEKLFAVIQESSDDVESELKIYSLHFPPLPKEALMTYKASSESNTDIYILLISSTIIIVILSFWTRKYRINKTNSKLISKSLQTEEKEIETQANAIYLFGEFVVFDRQHKDITHLFSEQLKQTLCLLFEADVSKGISSQELTYILWPDKDGDKAKNSRGVTINNLRKALSDLDGIELVYEKGYFKLVIEEPFYCDYLRCSQFLEDKTSEDEFINIIQRGKFLKHTEDPIYDTFKAKVEQKLEPQLLSIVEYAYNSGNYVKALDAIDALFYLDPLHTEALVIKVKILANHNQKAEAKEVYQKFAQEYRQVMGVDFSTDYQSIITAK